jgi:Zn-dependent protease/predicted transcriptional regulator
MDGTRFRLLRVRGIPIYIDLSWLIVFALVTLTVSGLFRQSAPELPTAHVWIMAVIAALGFFTCIVLHELGHALVGRASGMPIRGITLFLFGGVAELGREPPSAKSEFWMAIAGPAVTAVLIVLFVLLRSVGEQAGWPLQVLLVLDYLGYINIMVLIFNLVPAFPLDGGRVFRAAAWAWTGDLRRATRWASLTGRGFGYLLAIWGAFQLLLFLNVAAGMWMIFIGLFLSSLARRSFEDVVARELLAGEPVSRFMSPDPITVDPNLDLRHLVEDYVYRHHRKVFPVMADGHVEGLVSAQSLQNVPRDAWDQHTVSEIMERDVGDITITPQTDALRALRQMQQSGSTRLLVMENGRLVGIVSLRDLMDFLNLKLSMEGTKT